MSRRPWVVRHPLTSLLLVLLLALCGWCWQERVALRAFPGIISAYTAKEYCSCRYVMGQSAAYCQGYVRQWLPISEFVDDPNQRQVSAAGLGVRSSAQWLGAREGCRLQP